MLQTDGQTLVIAILFDSWQTHRHTDTHNTRADTDTDRNTHITSPTVHTQCTQTFIVHTYTTSPTHTHHTYTHKYKELTVCRPDGRAGFHRWIWGRRSRSLQQNVQKYKLPIQQHHDHVQRAPFWPKFQYQKLVCASYVGLCFTGSLRKDNQFSAQKLGCG